VSFTPAEVASGAIHYNYGGANFANDEMPGVSVFYKNETGEVFHTYSCYARGAEPMLGVYQYLDLTPKGRDEGGLPFTMAWVRHHDKYEGAPKTASCCHEEHGR
jgi:predicted dithiol-disulfide oxidoreductase (DUF899 family)